MVAASCTSDGGSDTTVSAPRSAVIASPSPDRSPRTPPIPGPPGWFVPPLSGIDAPLEEVCDAGVCVADLVTLPVRRFVDIQVDVPMPEPLGAASVDRIWTGERSGLFGHGWESLWDLRLVEGRIVGPVPSRPLAAPRAGASIPLVNGTSLRFDHEGRLVTACTEGARCATAQWPTDGDGLLAITPDGDRTPAVELLLENARVVEVRSVDGRNATYDYVSGRLVDVAAPSGTTAYGYDTAGRLTSIDGPRDTRRIEYQVKGDDDGRSVAEVSTLVDRDGATWDFSRSADSVMVETAGRRREHRFSDDGLVEIVDDELGVMVRRIYSDGAMIREERPVDDVVMERTSPTTVVVTEQPEGSAPREIHYEIDERGRLVATESAEGRTTYRYDTLDDGRSVLAAVRTATGETSFVYDDRGLLVSTTDADGYVVELDRDASGLVRRVSDGLTETTFDHDAAGRVVSERSGERQTSASYTSWGEIAEIRSGARAEVDYGFDASGRLTRIDGPSPARLTYAGSGAAASADDPATGIVTGANTPGDDALEFMLERSGPDAPSGATSSLGQDESLTIDQDSDGVTLTTSDGSSARFDRWGRVLEVERDGKSASREYDEAGRLVRVIEEGREYLIDRTPAGRIAAVTTDVGRVDVSWHGELITSLRLPDETTLDYEYDAAGQLVSTTSGPARWHYTRDEAGNVAAVAGPGGVTEYGWGADGLPTTTRLPSGAVHTYAWDGDHLVGVEDPSSGGLELRRDPEGRPVEIIAEDRRVEIRYDPEGRIASYGLADGTEGVVTHGVDGVERIELGDHVERWEWTDDEITSVVVGEEDDDQRFDVSWHSPGVFASVASDDGELLTTTADPHGQVTSVRAGDRSDGDDDGNDEDATARFTWDRYGIAEAVVAEERLQIDRDGLGRVTRVLDEDVDYRAFWDGGVVSMVASTEGIQEFEYTDGHVSRSVVRIGDERVQLLWNGDGTRVTGFATPEGVGSFRYTDGRVTSMGWDGEEKAVEVADDASLDADGFAGDLLDDLFDDLGRFRGAETPLAPSPEVPLLDELPDVIGLTPPVVLTADSVVEAAIELTTPELPLPLLMGDATDLVDRTVSTVLAAGATVDLPVGPGQHLTTALAPSDNDIGELLLSSASMRTADVVLDRFAAGECLLCRAADFGVSVLTGIGSVATSIYRFIADNPVTRTALSVAFIAASTVAATLCTAIVCRGLTLVGVLLVAELVTGDSRSLGELVYSSTVGPFVDLAREAISLEATALVAGAALVATIATRQPSPVIARIRPRIDAIACGRQRVVCISTAQYGPAAAHIREAQALGYGRVLRLDRAGTDSRRASSLRAIQTRAGFDRDEYPPAYLKGPRPKSNVSYIEPWANRGAGAALGAQTRGLPDGARIWVRAIG